MPTFEVQHPKTGKIIEIDGPQMPSDQELEGIFAQTGNSTPGPMQANAPAQSQGKSVGGFLGNVVKSGANFASNTVEGLWDMGTGIASAVNPWANQFKGEGVANKAKAIAGAIPEVGAGIKNYAVDRYGSIPKIGETLYNDPVGVLGDISSVTSLGASKIPALGKVSRLTNPATPVMAAGKKVVGGVANKVGNKIANRGDVKAKNAAYVDRTLNPTGATAAGAGTAVKTDILTKKQNTFRGLEAEYDDILGSEGGYAPVAPVATPPNLVGMGPDSKAPSYTNMRGKQPFMESTDTPLARSRQAFDEQKTLRRPGNPGSPDLVVETNSVEQGPSFREMHGKQSHLRGTEREAMHKNMREAAEYSGLTAEADRYFNTTKAWGRAKQQFENKFVNKLLNTPDEAIAGLFEQPRLQTYKPKNTDSIYAGARAKTFSNQELVGQLQQIVRPETMKRLQASIGENIKRRIARSDGSFKPDVLNTFLDKMDRNGLADTLIPNHRILRDIVTVLTEEATQQPSRMGRNVVTGVAAAGAGTAAYRLGGPTAAAVASTVTAGIVHKLLQPGPLKPKNIEHMVKQLQRSRDPKAQQIAAILNQAGLAAAQAEKVQDEYMIPEPPRR